MNIYDLIGQPAIVELHNTVICPDGLWWNRFWSRRWKVCSAADVPMRKTASNDQWMLAADDGRGGMSALFPAEQVQVIMACAQPPEHVVDIDHHEPLPSGQGLVTFKGWLGDVHNQQRSSAWCPGWQFISDQDFGVRSAAGFAVVGGHELLIPGCQFRGFISSAAAPCDCPQCWTVGVERSE